MAASVKGLTPAQSGAFELGPTDGNCFEAWSLPETVESAHDQSAEANNPYPKTQPNTNRT